MTTALSDFYPEIELVVQDTPRPVIDYHLRRIIDDFLRRTWIYFSSLDETILAPDGRVVTYNGVPVAYSNSMTTIEDQKDYILTDPNGLVIIGIVKIEEDGYLTSKAYSYHSPTRKLMLQSNPQSGDVLDIVTALSCPLDNTAIYPAFLSDQYTRTLASGVIPRLLPPDDQRIPYYLREYERVVNRVKAEAQEVLYGQNGVTRGRVRTDLRVKTRRFV